MRNNIQSAALQAHQQALGVLNDLVSDTVQVRRGAPICVELLQHDGILCHAGDKLEGAGTHRGGILLVVISGQDGGGHEGNKLVAGLCNGDGNGLFVQSFHAPDNRKRLHQRSSIRGVGAARDRIYNVLCCHHISVMELHAFTQGKGVGQLVFGNFVVVGNCRDQITGRSRLHQAFKYVEHDFLSSCRHRDVGVKTIVQVLCDTNHDFVGLSTCGGLRCGGLLLAAASATGEYGAQNTAEQQNCQKFLFHFGFSFSSLPDGSVLGGPSALTEIFSSIQL